MKFFKQRPLWIVLIFLSLLCGQRSSQATLMLSVNLQQLNQYADRIFWGIVQGIEEKTDEEGRWCQFITFEIEETFKGDLGTTLTIKQVNPNPMPLSDGTVIRNTLFADVPQYEVGEEVLVFLGPTTPIGFTTSVGLGQGTFRIGENAEGKRVLHNAMQNKGLLRRMDNRSFHSAPGMSLSQFQRLQHEPSELTLNDMRILLQGLVGAEGSQDHE